MPNHCESDLKISGNPKRLKAFKEFARSVKEEEGYGEDGKYHTQELDHEKFIPYPKKFRDMDKLRAEAEKAGAKWQDLPKDGFNSGGYEWCIQNWGTKWGIYDCQLMEESNSHLMYSFYSAWSPPLPVIQKMSEMFPELLFSLKYYECGAAYQGTFEVEEGEVITDEQQDYDGDRGG